MWEFPRERTNCSRSVSPPRANAPPPSTYVHCTLLPQIQPDEYLCLIKWKKERKIQSNQAKTKQKAKQLNLILVHIKNHSWGCQLRTSLSCAHRSLESFFLVDEYQHISCQKRRLTNPRSDATSHMLVANKTSTRRPSWASWRAITGAPLLNLAFHCEPNKKKGEIEQEFELQPKIGWPAKWNKPGKEYTRIEGKRAASALTHWAWELYKL